MKDKNESIPSLLNRCANFKGTLLNRNKGKEERVILDYSKNVFF
jgi:hypothetical protein